MLGFFLQWNNEVVARCESSFISLISFYNLFNFDVNQGKRTQGRKSEAK